MVPKVLPEMETLKAKLERGARSSSIKRPDFVFEPAEGSNYNFWLQHFLAGYYCNYCYHQSITNSYLRSMKYIVSQGSFKVCFAIRLFQVKPAGGKIGSLLELIPS